MGDDEERNGPVKSTDFLCSERNNTLRARNRGWETQIEVERKYPGSPQHWVIEVKGNPKKEKDVKKITDALEIQTYKEAKKLASRRIKKLRSWLRVLERASRGRNFQHGMQTCYLKKKYAANNSFFSS